MLLTVENLMPPVLSTVTFPPLYGDLHPYSKSSQVLIAHRFSFSKRFSNQLEYLAPTSSVFGFAESYGTEFVPAGLASITLRANLQRG